MAPIMFPLKRSARGDRDIERVVAVQAPDAPIPLQTNAPGHWPAVRVTEGASTESSAAYNARVSLAIAAAFKEAGLSVVEFSREVPVDGGKLVVDLVVHEEGREMPVIVLPGADPQREGETLDTMRDALAAGNTFRGSPVTWYAPRAPVTRA